MNFVGGIEFIDEFFAKVPERRIFNDLDFSRSFDGALGEVVPKQPEFIYTAPYCLERVEVGPQAEFGPLEAGGPLRQVRNDVNLETWVTRAIPEALFLDPPEPQEGPEVFGQTTADARGVFKTEDILEISFRLVEVYPSDTRACPRWPWTNDFPADECGETYVPGQPFSRKTEAPDPETFGPIVISFLDGISGRDFVADAGAYDPTQTFGFVLTTLGTGTVNPFAPLTVDLQVTFDRRIDGSFIFFDRSAILVGTIEEDVPQLIPVMTSPTFVFGIIRDPPGGTSKTTLAEGTSLKTSMSIAGMQTSTLARTHSISYTQGLGTALSLVVSPLGVGVMNPGTKIDYKQGVTWSGTGPSVTAERGSSQAWDLDFKFDFSVSTSGEPWLAGEPYVPPTSRVNE